MIGAMGELASVTVDVNRYYTWTRS